MEGRAGFVEDLAVRNLASSLSSYPPAERYILFELGVESALAVNYVNGDPVRRHWKSDPEL